MNKNSKGYVIVIVLSILILGLFFVMPKDFESQDEETIEIIKDKKKIADNDGVILSADEVLSCYLKPDNLNDGYKTCEAIIEIENTKSKINLQSLSNRFKLDFAKDNIKKKQNKHNLIFYYSEDYDECKETLTNETCYEECSNELNELGLNYNGDIEQDCDEECNYKIDRRCWSNWINFEDSDKNNIETGEIMAFKVVFEQAQYESNFYNFTLKGNGKDYIIDPDVSTCGTLNTAGGIYTQIADINQGVDANCIIIDNENITYDGGGFSITSIYNQSGIYSTKVNTTIKNTNISMAYGGTYPAIGIGIKLDGANNSHIYNNTLNKQQRGIWTLASTINTIIENNTFYNNSQRCVKSLGDNNTFRNNTCTTFVNEYAFYFASSTNGIIEDNNIIGAGIQSGSLPPTSITIRGNRISNCGIASPAHMGIFHGEIIENNIINNCTLGIYFLQDKNAIVNNNTFIDNDESIRVTGVAPTAEPLYNIFTNNTFYNSTNAIVLQQNADSNNFSSNRIYDCDFGIKIGGGSSNIFDGTQIVNITNYAVGFIDINRGFTSNNNMFKNGIITNASLNDIFGYIGTANTNQHNFLNYTMNHSNNNITDTSINIMWYFSAQVNNSDGGTPLKTANVSAYNVAGLVIDSVLTNTNGFASLEIIEYLNTNGTRNYYSNYSINVTKLSYTNDSLSINSTTNLEGDFLLTQNSALNPLVVNITYPLNQSYYYIYPNNTLNYTVISGEIDSCWYSNDSGTTNSTSIIIPSPGDYFFDVNIPRGESTIFTVYCNDSFSAQNFSTINVTVDEYTKIPIYGCGRLWGTGYYHYLNHSLNGFTTDHCLIFDEQNITFDGNGSTFLSGHKTEFGGDYAILYSNIPNSTINDIGINGIPTSNTASAWYGIIIDSSASYSTISNLSKEFIAYHPIIISAPFVTLENINATFSTGENWQSWQNHISISGDNSLIRNYQSQPSRKTNEIILSSDNNQIYESNISTLTISGENNSVVNTTLATVSMSANAQYYRKWYLDVQANYSNGTAINSATVLAYRNNGALIENKSTNSSGQLRLELIEYSQISSTKYYYSNYSINVTFPGYNVNSTSLNITNNKELSVTLVDTEPPELTIVHPKPQTYSINESLSLNFTAIDLGSGMSICWYQILNSTEDIIISNTTLASCQNTTFNVPDEQTFTLYLYGNDTLNNFQKSSVIFSVSTTKPAVVLDYPEDNGKYTNTTNFYFKYTATDSDGIGTCELWGDWNDGWHKDYTWISPESAVQNFTSFDMGEGYFKYNVWCNDTLGNEGWGLNNKSFLIDETFPLLEIISIDTKPDSQTFIFNYAITETNPSSCFYSIFDSTGAIDPATNENETISCTGNSKQETVSAFASYNLTVYAVDKAGNENSTTQQFTVSTTTPSSGGGISIVTTGIFPSLLAQDFSALTRGLGNTLDIILAKDSVKPRKKEFLLINKGIEPIELELRCSTTDLLLNDTEELRTDINICDYVTFEQDTITISPNEDDPTKTSVFVFPPENVSFRDKFGFNILVVQEFGNTTTTFSKLSVSVRFPYFGMFLRWQDYPFQAEDKEEKSSYPVIIPALFLSMLIFAITILFTRKRFPVTGFFIALIFGLATLFLIVFHAIPFL